MASLGGEQLISTNSQSEPAPIDRSREGSIERKARDREEKLRLAKERQNEERQKKIEELKAQAEAAQKYREQKEEERKRRIEEIRHRDNEKRQQVEERKKAIIEAEKERREYILRKNQEREARLEVKKRDRNSIGFAFGSSTPRLLEPADFGTVSPSIYWGHRRSTSITNVAYTGAPLSRRSSERELADGGSKKRATSASGADRHDGRAFSMNRLDQLAQPIRRNGEHIRAIVEREKQHQLEMLMESESLNSSSAGNEKAKRTADGGNRKNMSRSMSHLVSSSTMSSGHAAKLSHSKHIVVDSVGSAFRPLNEMECKAYNQLTARRKTTQSSFSTGYRSGDVTPGGSNNTSRPGSAMSTSTNMSMSGYVHRRPATTPRKPRPASIAGTGVSLDEINKQREKHRTPVKNSTQTTPKRSSLMTTSTSASRVSSVERKTPAKKDVAQTRVQTTPKSSLSKTSSSERIKDKTRDMTQSLIIENPKTKDEKNALNVVKTEEASEQQQQQQQPTSIASESSPSDVDTETKSIGETVNSSNSNATVEPIESAEPADEKADQGNEKEIKKEAGNHSNGNSKEGSVVREVQLLSDKQQQDINDMSASMIAKSKITTEEEAKAALAERRRVAREEAERQAELERQRLEAERLAEIKRQEEEAERERKFEEEATRLAQEQRRAEEERLRQAIEEVRLREEEERLRREEEEKQRLEREEAEKKAKEEAEKQKIEVAERLKREEKEREERRKRVEAIMSRTRKSGSANTPNSTPVKENENSKADKVVPPVQTPVTEVKSIIIDDNIKSQTDILNAAAPPITASSETNVLASNDNISVVTSTTTTTLVEPQNSQAMYEQSVMDKESALMKSFSAMIIDENTKNLHNLQQNQLVDVTNGKISEHFPNSEGLLHNTVANGNGHLENINNKNEINILQDVSSTNQLIDLSIESQDINNAVNFNNNNSLLATTNTLVNADSHENKEISLL